MTFAEADGLRKYW